MAGTPVKRRRRTNTAAALLLLSAAVFLSYCASISCRVTSSAFPPPDLRRRHHSAAVSEETSTLSTNSTLLRLAAVDHGDAGLDKEIESLLDGSFRPADPRFRSVADYRRLSYILERIQRPGLTLRPKQSRARNVYPEFRRLLRDWASRRRARSDDVAELTSLVKRELDRHYTGGGLDFSSRRRYGSCAVVGNSGILLRHRRGGLIDGHDLVIRLNNARTVGYERHVGSKTGLAFVNSHILRLCGRRAGCFCEAYGPGVPILLYICQPAHFVDLAVCNGSRAATAPPVLVTDPRFDRVCARIAKYYSLRNFAERTGRRVEEWDRDPREFHYSSGMQAVVLAVGICERVSLFGFGKSVSAGHHYHTNQKAELSLHDYEAEYAFYRDLVRRPAAVPFLSDLPGFRVPPVVAYDWLL